LAFLNLLFLSPTLRNTACEIKCKKKYHYLGKKAFVSVCLAIIFFKFMNPGRGNKDGGLSYFSGILFSIIKKYSFYSDQNESVLC